MKTVDVEVLVTSGCHLCAQALAETEKACAEFGLPYREVDIAEHPQLTEQFREEVPVLRINGEVRDFWVFDPKRLHRLLAEATAAGQEA